MSRKMNHVEYPKGLLDKTEAALRWIIKDCQEALEANPAGSNSSYYLDEINYCVNELYNRTQAAKAKGLNPILM